MALEKTPVMKFKTGDTFYIEITFNSSKEPENVLLYEAIVEAQAAYDEALAADPQVPVDVAAALLEVQNAQATYDAAIVIDVTGWSFHSEIFRKGRLLSTLTPTVIDASIGKVSLSANDTDWATGLCKCDIQTTNAFGEILSTETFHIDVSEDYSK